jgi:MFS family permease
MTVDAPSTGAEPETLFALRSRTGFALVAATVLASMVAFLDAYMINVAVPAIGADLHATVTELQWVLTGYLITVAALLLLAGALADHFGRRRILVVGLLVMLVTSLGCAAAPTSGALIAARLAQGVGAALVVPSSLALLNGTLRGPDRARGIGLWAGLATLGTTFGPYGGGWLVDHASWRWVFLLNIPVIVAALLVLRVVPEVDLHRRPLSVDLLGGLLAVLGLGGVIYALTKGPTSGWDDAYVLASAGVGSLCLAALSRWSSDAADPCSGHRCSGRVSSTPSTSRPCCSTEHSLPPATWSSWSASSGSATPRRRPARLSSRSRSCSYWSPRSSAAS